MNEIVLENDLADLFSGLCSITTTTLDIMLKEENGGDLIALYFFIYKKCKDQKTNQPWLTNGYIETGLNWSKARVKNAKDKLEELGLIEIVKTRNGEHFGKSYTKLKYIIGSTYISKRNSQQDVLPACCSTTEPENDRAGRMITNAGSNLNINAGSNGEQEMLKGDPQTIPHKEKEEVSNTSNENSSSLYGNTDDTLTSNKDTDNTKTSSKRKNTSQKTYSYPTYEEIVAAYGATELNKVIYSMIEDLHIQQNLTIKDIGKIREEIIKLSLDKFVNVFYRDHEGAYHGSSVVISDMIKFIGYFQNNPDKEIKSLIGRIRTWLTHKF